jgi:hypothetical protein
MARDVACYGQVDDFAVLRPVAVPMRGIEQSDSRNRSYRRVIQPGGLSGSGQPTGRHPRDESSARDSPFGVGRQSVERASVDRVRVIGTRQSEKSLDPIMAVVSPDEPGKSGADPCRRAEPESGIRRLSNPVAEALVGRARRGSHRAQLESSRPCSGRRPAGHAVPGRLGCSRQESLRDAEHPPGAIDRKRVTHAKPEPVGMLRVPQAGERHDSVRRLQSGGRIRDDQYGGRRGEQSCAERPISASDELASPRKPGNGIQHRDGLSVRDWSSFSVARRHG